MPTPEQKKKNNVMLLILAIVIVGIFSLTLVKMGVR